MSLTFVFAAFRRQDQHCKAKEGDFAVIGRRPGLSALDLTSFMKKAGPKTFKFAPRFQECFFDS
ncbi:MAG: hypothetical protein IKN55_07255 [Oscillospiraceae bacterium]|nr:hypothetical protein [Oscillospiraceae bacterium]